MVLPFARQLAIYTIGIVLAVIVFIFSLLSFRSHRMPLAERQEVASQSIWIKIAQLQDRPYLPDHPLYPFKMLSDRIILLVTPKEQQIERKIEYANIRLSYASRLLATGRRSLALSTATKAEKYLLSASQEFLMQNPRTSSESGDRIVRAISFHKTTLLSMKDSFTDEQKAVVDNLIEQLDILFVQ